MKCTSCRGLDIVVTFLGKGCNGDYHGAFSVYGARGAVAENVSFTVKPGIRTCLVIADKETLEKLKGKHCLPKRLVEELRKHGLPVERVEFVEEDEG